MSKYIRINDSIYDSETGEYTSQVDASKEYNNNLINQYNDNVEDIAEINGELEYKLIKIRSGQEFYVSNVKPKYEFTKTFKTDVRVMKPSLSPYAKVFILEAQPYLHYPTNTIVCNGENPSLDTLCEWCEVKVAKMYRILKELEDKDVIKRRKLNGRTVVYFNPYLYSCGLTDEVVNEMFNESNYNPRNRQG
ncbi:helix-turn-helix domain-containing protein [Aquibacillus saliphilus]|uniref:helix-turn-helix domain-containing protein n=1 Tax=Aquibacillus saliphilus TaxID=1909422 RepID=UPI001CF03174|nr:helix-turn-helix domain-containing protein [Aquibacillus saliphilus]